MTFQLPKSPITMSESVSIFDRFSSRDIVDMYNQQEAIDVARYYSDLNDLYLLKCEDTGYKFYYPFETIGDDNFYEALQIEHESRGHGYDRDWSEDHDFALKQIEKDERVLEIGCSTGKFLEGISKITKNAFGIELNPLAAKNAKEKGLNVKTELIETHLIKNIGTYDVVCAFQVLEHVAEVKPFVEDAVKLLKPGGKLIFSVPNNEPYYQRFSRLEV